MLNILSQVICNLLYIFKSKFYSLGMSIPFGKNYIVFKFKYTVYLIDRIDIFDILTYLMFSDSASLGVLLYICVVKWNHWHHNLVLFTPTWWLIVKKYILKKNGLFLVIMSQVIISVSQLCCCELIPPIEHVLLSIFLPFERFKFPITL